MIAPLRAWAHPYVAPVWEPVMQATSAQRERFNELYPVWKQRAVAALEQVKAQAATLRVQIQAAIQPSMDQLMGATEEPRLVLAAFYRDIVEPYVLSLQSWLAAAQSVMADVVYVVTDVLLQCCSQWNPVAPLLHVVHDHSAETVQYAQVSFAVAILAFLGLRRCRRCSSKTTSSKAKFKFE
jgi:hypothetical protein